MLTKKCIVCGKKFKVSPCNDRIKHCSCKCAYVTVSQKLKGKKLSKETKDKMSKAKKGKQPKHTMNWKGKNHPNWKGGKVNQQGRWRIHNPKHPNSNCSGYVLQYHLVAEKHLRRYLVKGEIIHHINGNESDDRPENLYLFENIGKHTRYHNLKNKSKLKSNLI